MMFAGKCYWIVGASEGLGRALAVALDAEGASLVLSARSADRLADLASTLRQAQVVACNVMDSASVEAAAANLPPLDGIIYAVGLYEPMAAQNWNAAAAVAMAEANFVGALRVLAHVAPGFANRGAGHIVLIGSLAGFRGLPGAIGYGASKAGLMHLAQNLQADLWQSGVRVQLINPGYIQTRLTAKNDFAMPFIMTAPQAAAHVLRAMRSRRFQTSFPRPFSWLFLTSRFLPEWIYFRLFRKT
jgi:short-subunit dehydrogenase